MQPCATASALNSLAIATRLLAIKGLAKAVESGYLSPYNAFALIAGKAKSSIKGFTRSPIIDLNAPDCSAFLLFDLNLRLGLNQRQK